MGAAQFKTIQIGGAAKPALCTTMKLAFFNRTSPNGNQIENGLLVLKGLDNLSPYSLMTTEC